MFGRTEKAHAVIPKYKEGQLIPDNMADLELPLHAFQHLLTQESLGKSNDKDAHAWSVGAIVRRMTDSEREEFNRLVALHESDRRNGGW